MLIPKGGNVFTASTYMNFVYDPKIAAQIEDYVNYICPVKGAKEELQKIDPDVAKNTLIFPTAADARQRRRRSTQRRLPTRSTSRTWQNLISG